MDRRALGKSLSNQLLSGNVGNLPVQGDRNHRLQACATFDNRSACAAEIPPDNKKAPFERKEAEII